MEDITLFLCSYLPVSLPIKMKIDESIEKENWIFHTSIHPPNYSTNYLQNTRWQWWDWRWPWHKSILKQKSQEGILHGQRTSFLLILLPHPILILMTIIMVNNWYFTYSIINHLQTDLKLWKGPPSTSYRTLSLRYNQADRCSRTLSYYTMLPHKPSPSITLCMYVYLKHRAIKASDELCDEFLPPSPQTPIKTPEVSFIPLLKQTSNISSCQEQK